MKDSFEDGMGRTSTNLAPVGPVGSITDNVDTHLSLGRLDGRVRLTWESSLISVSGEREDERQYAPGGTE